MATQYLDKLGDLIKALEAGFAVGPPGSLTQGAALQRQDLSPVMNLVTFGESKIKLQKDLPIEKATSLTVEFNRQLDYGIPGGSATLEVSAGQDDTANYVRALVPMAFYVNRRTVSFAADEMESFDGQKSSEREAKNAAMKIAFDVERDLYQGKSDFSNGGVFDGNPLAVPQRMPGMNGLDLQIRQSDGLLNTQDLMFYEYGSNASVVISIGGVLQQGNIEDMALRSNQNMGEASELHLSIDALAAYNKLAFGKERIVLGGTAQGSTGANLLKQFTSAGPIDLVATQFLRAKTSPPATIRALAPAAPTISLAQTAGSTSFALNDVYSYFVTGVNEAGESAASAISGITISALGNYVTITITAGTGTTRWYNVYRSAAASTVATAASSLKFIGRVAAAVTGGTTFTDLGNKKPGSSVCILLDKRGWEMPQLKAFTGVDLATVDTANRKLFYRFVCLKGAMPRFSVIGENVT